jgi:hypothetical protein
MRWSQRLLISRTPYSEGIMMKNIGTKKTFICLLWYLKGSLGGRGGGGEPTKKKLVSKNEMCTPFAKE